MNIEQSVTPEKLKGRERLLSLEKEGKFVFHGSPNLIDILKPRQAENKNKATGEMEKHGEPAVCATRYADFAIFRALTNFSDEVGPSDVGFGTDEKDSLWFKASSNILELTKKKTGKVYVLDIKNFKPLEEGCWEFRCPEEVIPLEIVEVSSEDLPKNIQVMK
jgi:hypothetical protein